MQIKKKIENVVTIVGFLTERPKCTHLYKYMYINFNKENKQ